jgi:hypothetical protein
VTGRRKTPLPGNGAVDAIDQFHIGWTMKAVKIAVIMILVLNGVFSLVNWLSEDKAKLNPPYQALVQPTGAETTTAADGLSLPALTALVKEIRSGQELERRLNQPNGINNLDLAADEQVDYLFVTEFGDVTDKVGYSLTVQPAKDEIQEIATVTVERNGDRAEIQVVGNEQLYGDKAIYNDWTSVERTRVAESSDESDVALHTSYFHPHPLWISPWFFGFYPPYFAFFPIVGQSSYVSRVGRQYHTGSVGRGANLYQQSSGKTVRNPNQGKTAARGIARSLRNPTNTQKQFQATRRRNLSAGGFGQPTAGQSGSAGVNAPASRTRSLGTSAFVRSTSTVDRRRSVFSSRSVRSRSLGSRGFRIGRR